MTLVHEGKAESLTHWVLISAFTFVRNSCGRDSRSVRNEEDLAFRNRGPGYSPNIAPTGTGLWSGAIELVSGAVSIPERPLAL